MSGIELNPMNNIWICLVIVWIFNALTLLSIYRMDKAKPEPFSALGTSFIVGCSFAFLSLFVGGLLCGFPKYLFTTVLLTAKSSPVITSIVIETMILIALVSFAKICKAFDEYVDGIVYAFFISNQY